MIHILLLSPQLRSNAYLQALSQRPELSIVGVERDLERALECAKELKPDVIIADSRESTLDLTILRILLEGIAPVVIVLNVVESRLRLYRSDEWQVNDVEDLLQAIWAEPMLG